jgi:histone-lysine N-methyltransferase SETMAR
LEDRRISTKSIAEQVGISRERAGYIIHEDLDMLKVTKGVLFLHDNASAHRALATHKKMAYLAFQCLGHPPYSPDLAPSDYHLFPGLKKQSKGRHFSSDAEVIAATETWLDRQMSEFFGGLQKLEQRAKKCIELRAEYVE